MTPEPCAKCGRTLRDIRRDLSVDAMRGGAPLCPLSGCPVVARLAGFAALGAVRGREIEGAAPSVFVGRHGYPTVAAGPLVPPGEAAHPLLLESPSAWLDHDIAELVAVRSRLLRTRAPVHVVRRVDATRLLDAAREAAMSERPVETAVTLAREPAPAAPRLDLLAPPMGPGVEVERARVLGHAVVPRRVDALVADVHAKAEVAVGELAAAGVSGHHIERLLSVGLLGEAQSRRLVPTRWAITATDDMLGKRLLEEIRALPELGEIRLHHATRLGNRFWVILLPRAWSFEMLEAWQAGGRWEAGRDGEGFRGRTKYVDEVAGAYYAARLAVAEHLVASRRQGAVVVVREITEDYWAPLGVWLIRESVRLALREKPLVFGELAAVLAHVTRHCGHKEWAARSEVLREARVQRRLSDFGSRS